MPLFETIERAIFAAQLSVQSSYRLWAALSNVAERWRRPGLLLLPVVEAIPSLRHLIDDFAADRTQLARAVGMSLAAVTTQLRAAEANRQTGEARRQTSDVVPSAAANKQLEQSLPAPLPVNVAGSTRRA